MKPLDPISSPENLNALISRCVHCGFCNATCPTYLVTGLELEGPRGRIALIRSMLKGQPVSHKTRDHLDHCLTCLGCETTCPSGVKYSHIIDRGRQWLNTQHPRPIASRLPRFLLTHAMNHPGLLHVLIKTGRGFRSLLPRAWSAYLKKPQKGPPRLTQPIGTRRRVLIVAGCVQRSLAPGIDDALSMILEKLGYQVIPITKPHCCGALGYHLGEVQSSKAQAIATLKALEPYCESPNGEHPIIVMSSSACGLMLTEYPRVFKDDPKQALRAERIHPWICDPLMILERHVDEVRARLLVDPLDTPAITLHEPCTLQHGLRLRGQLVDFFRQMGFKVSEGRSPQICCGAGGIHSLLNPVTSKALRTQKRADLGLDHNASGIALTSNIGCMLHLDEKGDVQHWLEFLALQL